RLVAGDREYPGGNLRTPFEMACMLPDVEKHVARKVLGGGRVVHDPEHETVDSQMMARVEALHRDFVMGSDTFYEPVHRNRRRVRWRGGRKTSKRPAPPA